MLGNRTICGNCTEKSESRRAFQFFTRKFHRISFASSLGRLFFLPTTKIGRRCRQHCQRQHLPNFGTMVDTNDQLHALWRQEASTYKTHEYLLRLQQQQQASSSSVAGSGDGSASSQGFINQRWRDKICEWAYQGECYRYIRIHI